MHSKDNTQLAESPTAIFVIAGLFVTVVISAVALFSLISLVLSLVGCRDLYWDFSSMSYQKKIDDMAGKHVAQFQLELSLAKTLEGLRCKPPMPYGYPIRVYQPMHICKVPQVRDFITRTGGKLSNGVPRVLRMELVNHYPLGTYNPVIC